jgi:hypothetical protein
MPETEENDLTHELNNGHKFDLLTANALSTFSRNTSRRGLLAAGGRLFLKALGISMLPLLPLYRVFAQGAPTQNCKGDWQYCGQHGNFCNACCGAAAGITSCPPCTNQETGDAWNSCCCCPGCQGGFTILYIDCCGLVTPVNGVKYTNADAAACKGNQCRNTLTFGWWCGGGGTYRCTIINPTTPCKNCKSTS